MHTVLAAYKGLVFATGAVFAGLALLSVAPAEYMLSSASVMVSATSAKVATGEISVATRGLPSGAHPRYRLSGPGFSQVLRVNTVVVPPGTYQVKPLSLKVRGVSYVPSSSVVSVGVKRSSKKAVRLRYVKEHIK